MAIKLKVVNRKGKDLGLFEFPSDATVQDLKNSFSRKYPHWYPDRQWFTVGDDAKKVPLKSASQKLSAIVKDGDVVVFKDLGPQIGWRTVFYIEYFGPLLMHALFYCLPSVFYSQPVTERHLVQTVSFWLVIIHYLKREYETCFIHRFSNGTMPFFNVFKNSFHYWLLGGAFIAYFLYHPLYTPPTFAQSPLVVYGAAALFLLFEAGNFYCHVILRDLRPAGTGQRGIPRGFLFEYTTCANYTCEVFAWLVFAVLTQTITGYIFLLVSTGQIAQWSLKKHIALKKEFGPKVPRRKILFPFLW